MTAKIIEINAERNIMLRLFGIEDKIQQSQGGWVRVEDARRLAVAYGNYVEALEQPKGSSLIGLDFWAERLQLAQEATGLDLIKELTHYRPHHSQAINMALQAVERNGE